MTVSDTSDAGVRVDQSRLPMSSISYRVRYQLMVTDQVPPHVMAEWLNEPLFAAFVEKRRAE